jgi:hypothetical protein
MGAILIWLLLFKLLAVLVKQLARLHPNGGEQQIFLPPITIQTIGMVYNFRTNPNNVFWLFRTAKCRELRVECLR